MLNTFLFFFYYQHFSTIVSLLPALTVFLLTDYRNKAVVVNG